MTTFLQTNITGGNMLVGNRQEVTNRPDHYLFKWDAPRQQFNEISRSQDGVGVKCFLSGADCNAALYQVQRGFDVLRNT